MVAVRGVGARVGQPSLWFHCEAVLLTPLGLNRMDLANLNMEEFEREWMFKCWLMSMPIKMNQDEFKNDNDVAEEIQKDESRNAYESTWSIAQEDYQHYE